MDIGFFWELLRELPASEAAQGHMDKAGADVTKASAIISDAFASGEGEVADALRPFYIDYLAKHGG